MSDQQEGGPGPPGPPGRGQLEVDKQHTQTKNTFGKNVNVVWHKVTKDSWADALERGEDGRSKAVLEGILDTYLQMLADGNKDPSIGEVLSDRPAKKKAFLPRLYGGMKPLRDLMRKSKQKKRKTSQSSEKSPSDTRKPRKKKEKSNKEKCVDAIFTLQAKKKEHLSCSLFLISNLSST